MRLFPIFAMFLFSISIAAIEEVEFSDKFYNQVWPQYDAIKKESMESFDGTHINYKAIRRGYDKALLILSGRTEPVDKYAEVVFDLWDLPYDIYLMDHRGQGFSERLLSDPLKGYVEKYEDYLQDINQFLEKVVQRKNYKTINLLAHSMGAGIGLRYAQVYPEHFTKLVLSSPMIELKLDGYIESFIVSYFGLLKLIGKKKEYIPGGGAPDRNPKFEENRVTHSLARWQMGRWLEKENEIFNAGSATVNWVLEAIQMGRKVSRDRKSLKGKSILMFQAELEEFSKYKRQDRVCKAVETCQKIFYKGSKHEMFMEKDEIRDDVMMRTRLFLQ